MPDLAPEDAKLVTLARSVLARTGAPEAAAVRDDTGRTYAASRVALPSLRLTALQAAVAAAVSSGAQGFEAAAVVTAAEPAAADLSLVVDIGRVPLHVADRDGTLRRTVSS